MALYELEIKVEQIEDGGDYLYLATSPDLSNLMFAGDTVEEVLTLAPRVAAALITSMQAVGDPLPPTLPSIASAPFASRIAVSV